MKQSQHIIACAGVAFYPSSSTSPVQLSSYASGGVLSKIPAVLLPGPPASITSAQASLLTTPDLCNLAHYKLSRLVLQLHNGMVPTANSICCLCTEKPVYGDLHQGKLMPIVAQFAGCSCTCVFYISVLYISICYIKCSIYVCRIGTVISAVCNLDKDTLLCEARGKLDTEQQISTMLAGCHHSRREQ